MLKIFNRFSYKIGKIKFKPFFNFCQNKNNINQDVQSNGTDYNNWILARASGHNHQIAHLKRKSPKDRYSLHKLTNIQYMCKIITRGYQYQLNQNQKIVLLAQFNHVIQVMSKNKKTYNHYSIRLMNQILKQLQNPQDLICFGTFMNALITMNYYQHKEWLKITDDILVQKFDQDYDQLFGLIFGLHKYKKFLKQIDDYSLISKDQVIPQIPIIYRNSLQVVRKFITQNIYNLKQTRILVQILYSENINQKYFWKSIRDWFNIYTKTNLNNKQFQQYFIFKQSAVQKVLHDHGIIRPRPILQQLSAIVFILSQFNNTSWRFIQFSQDLILYSIQNGSKLYEKFQIISKKQQEYLLNNDRLQINQHIQIVYQIQKQKIKQMQKKYRTLFINPIDIKDNYLVYFLVILARAYKQYDQPNKIKPFQQTKQINKKQLIYLDPRVKRWLMLRLVKPQMHYTLKQLLMIYKSRRFIQDSLIDLNNFIADKIKTLRQTHASYNDIILLLDIIPIMKFNILNEILQDFLNRNHPSQIISLVKYIQKKRLFPYMGQFMSRLAKSVNKHQKYYSFQQNCYFFLMLLQNQQSISVINDKQLLISHYSQLQRMKQLLKIITYSRGFKLTVNSYFHKVMDYIDVVQFFQGGQG